MKSFAIVAGVILSSVFSVFTITCTGRPPHSNQSSASSPITDAATDFLQQRPSEGVPASEKTEVRALFDDKNLYLGIHAFDSEPKQINARELVREDC